MRLATRLGTLLIGLGLGIGSALADPPGRHDHGTRGPAWGQADRGHGAHRVGRLPSHAPTVVWNHVPYRVDRGLWYRPSGHGHVVVRPPHGLVLRDRPAWATAVLIGGLTYLVAQDVYYRERADRRWEVVPPPAAPDEGTGRLFAYPRHGQGPEQQRQDEFECHRWAASQTGFDPSQAVAGAWPGAGARPRADYDRAFGTCLDARGYTVR